MATLEDIRRALEDLPPKSLAAKLRRLMPDIDRLIRSGVSHAAVRNTLAAQNLEVSAETFKKNLARWRRQNAISPQVAPAPAPPAIKLNASSPEVSAVGARDEPEIPAAAYERPFDLQRITAEADHYVSKPRPLFRMPERKG